MLKSKKTPIDKWIDTQGLTHMVYFDDDYKVRKIIYDLEGNYFEEQDELDDPSLKDYRVVLELTGTEH